MAVLIPWMWENCEPPMPAREVWRLTPRAADAFIERVLARRAARAQSA